MAGLHSVLYGAYLVALFAVLVTATPARRRLQGSDQTKVSLVLQALNSNTDGADVPLSRARRHTQDIDDALRVERNLLRAVDADTEASASERRQRRSAIFILTATVRFCQTHGIYCTRVAVDKGDLRMRLNVAEQ